MLTTDPRIPQPQALAPPLRRPSLAYKSRNGFAEYTSAQAAVNDASEESRLQDDTRKRRLAEWTLREKGQYFPSLAHLSQANDEPETASSVEKRIQDLQLSHSKDTESLHAYYAHVRSQEREDLRRSRQLSDVDESLLEDLDNQSTYALFFEMEQDHAKATMRHGHLSVLIPLQRQLAELNSRFPGSLDAYEAMGKSNHDAKLKVARFLMANGQLSRQDSIMSEMGWAWRQVQPLSNVFKENAAFRHEVQRFIKDHEPTDPRRRASLA